MSTINLVNKIIGTDLNDRIRGTVNLDRILALDGDDTVLGGAGDDTIYGQEGDDLLIGGIGEDRLIAGPGKDTLRGGGGDDFLKGSFPLRSSQTLNFRSDFYSQDFLSQGFPDLEHELLGENGFSPYQEPSIKACKSRLYTNPILKTLTQFIQSDRFF